jgi:hypothetical protein
MYLLHRVKGEHNYPWVSLRVIINRPRNGTQIINVQLLDFIDSLLPEERTIHLKKLTVA